MKSIIIGSISLAALSFGAPAMAQSSAPSTAYPSVYASLGDSYLTPGYSGGIDEITGRIGARMGQNWGVSWGVEGEIGGGVSHYQRSVGAGTLYTNEPIAGAGYLVGYLPISPMPNLEFLARVGYGATATHESLNGYSYDRVTNSANFGVGAQYWLTSNDGVRADYTRRDYIGGTSIPDGADVWSLSYVRRF
jgi:hypothetical protein